MLLIFLICSTLFFRDANIEDLPLIVEIYNSTIAGRLVTADTEPVTVADKEAWFHEHRPSSRPLWMALDDEGNIIGWISIQDFYGRPAYNGTAEISIYIDERYRNRGFGKEMLLYSIRQCPSLGIQTLLGFIFAQNKNSLELFSKLGFKEWGHFPDVAVLDGRPCSLKILGLAIK